MCDRWGSDVLLDYVQRRLGSAQMREIAEHLGSCASCRALARDLESLSGRISAAKIEPSPETDGAVRNVIRRVSDRRFAATAIPEQEAVRPVKPGTRRIRILRRGWTRRGDASPINVFWAAAAALAIAFTVLFAALSGPSETPGESSTAVKVPSSPEVETPVRPVIRSLPAKEPRELKPVPAPQRPKNRTLRDPKPFRVPPPAAVPDSTPRRDAPKPRPPVPKPAIVRQNPRETVVEAAVEFAKVRTLDGRAEAKRGGTATALSQGGPVFAGDSISVRTGHLLLELADGSLVAVKGGSRLVPRFEEAHVSIDLAEGEVACSVRRRPDRRFWVATALGSATVRGTIFSVRAGGTGTVVVVAEGRVEARNKASARDVTAGFRSTMRSAGRPSRPERINAHKALSWAYEAGLHSLDKIWLAATDPAAIMQVPMTRGRLFAEGSLSGMPLFADTDSQKLPTWMGRFLPADRDEGGWVTYTLDIPETGEWYLWGRMFFPGSGTTLWNQNGPVRENDPNSFYVRVNQGPEWVFGNLKREAPGGISWYRRWHWNGDGRIEVGTPAALKLGTLTKGRHTLRIRNRDAVETTSLHLAARLDILCLTLDPAYVPKDEEVIK